ncbi:DUF4190 domain-containing protein [Halobacillus massiliensis]|uniref:DUF4190 domain-containing protein n=1 Tax=Halobacillus massiliensis TaxID=1926286 RepID=UPI0015C4B986|nr:DUF4190 domain-containing protein [Halobacillus massiliensis]
MDESRESVGNRQEQPVTQHEKERQQSEVERAASQPVYGESYNEEYAQESAVPLDEPIRSEERETTMEDDVKPGFGWVALTAAILSFFFAPFILGIVGIVLGVFGKRRGADTLGNMAIIISVISILFSLFLAPITQMI